MNSGQLYKLAAFAHDGRGGNPAGVWIGDALPDARAMQKMAREVGYSETAFVSAQPDGTRDIRYFSPEAEVSFCGHATIATGVALGRLEGEGRFDLNTSVGRVPVDVRQIDGEWSAALTSVATRHEIAPPALLDRALTLLGWRATDLDSTIPPVRAYAGAWHLVIAVSQRETLAALDYPFEALKALMLEHDLTTLQLIWRERADLIHSRNPFPVGGVVEDPATGASAAALGGYLRDARLVSAPASILIRQGETMGSPSVLTLDIPAQGGIIVSGGAIDL